MRTFSLSLSVIFISLFTFLHAQNTPIQFAHTHESPDLTYIQNLGQWHANVLFKTGIGGGNSIFLEKNSLTFTFLDQQDVSEVHELLNEHESLRKHRIQAHATRIHFLQANAKVTPEGAYKQPGIHNYFLGNDETTWATSVPLFKGVKYSGLYEGIDLFLHSSQQHFKYDFIVAPGADPGQIKLQYEGQKSLKIVAGELHMQTAVGEVIERKPFAYQWKGGKLVEVACQYHLENDVLSFIFPEGYDTEVELTIDPVLVASTLSGMSVNENYGHCAAFDKNGNIFTGAISFGSGYPTTTGAVQLTFAGGPFSFSVDMAISKYNPTGSNLIYATYLGGTEDDRPHSLITDPAGNLYVYGSTTSSNYPTTATAYDRTFNGTGTFPDPDIVVSKIDPTGTILMGSSFIGGTGPDGQTQSSLNALYGESNRGEIVVDDQGNAYIASCSASNNFPTTAGAYQRTFNTVGGTGTAQDAVIFKMSPDMSTLIWSTYLGGNRSDAALGLRLDEVDNVYVAGIAGANNFPTTPGAQYTTYRGGQEDGFVAKINSTGTSLLYSTFWGQGVADEHVYFLDLDNQGNVNIYGTTTGTFTPSAGTYRNLNSRQFIAALTPELDAIIFQTVVGAGGTGFSVDFAPVAFMVDKCNNIFFSGYQAVTGLPTTTGSFTFTSGFYLGVLDPLATGLQYATYYGDADHVDGGTSRFSKDGIVYQAVCSGSFSPLSTTLNAYARNQSVSWDIGVFKVDFELESVISSFSAAPSAIGCAPFTVNFQNTGDSAQQYRWYFGDGDSSYQENPIHIFATADTYQIMFVAIDSMTCNIADTNFLQVIVLPQAGTTTFSDTICAGDSILMIPQSAASGRYTWHNGNTSSAQYAQQGAGPFYVDINVAGCVFRDSFDIYWQPLPTSAFSASGPLCLGGDPSTVQFTGSAGPTATYHWDFAGGNPAPINGPGPFFVSWNTQNTYTLSLVTEEGGCFSDTTFAQVVVGPGPSSPFQAIPLELCEDEDFGNFLYNGNAPVTASFVWDFAGGEIEAGAGPGPYRVQWTDPGIKDVCLHVEWEGCVSDTTCIPIDVLKRPDAAFEHDSVCLGESTAFRSTSLQGGGLIDRFRWNFGDNFVDVGNDPTHQYNNDGQYDVQLIVTDVNGCSDTVIAPIIVWPTPEANFTVEALCMGSETRFFNQSTVNAPGQLASFRWDLDLGAFSDEENPTFRYPRNDKYNVSLEVLTQHGCFDRIERQLTVGAVPFSDFKANTVCEGEQTIFENLSSFNPFPDNDRIVRTFWDFGDGSSSTEETPEHRFRGGGKFQVSLISTSGGGCSDTVRQQVEVYPKPTFRFLSDTIVCPETSAILYARPNGNATVKWYKNSDLSDFRNEGSSYFLPTVWWRDTLYVKAQSTAGCLSNKEKVILDVYPRLNASMQLSSRWVEMPNSQVNFGITANRDIRSYLWDFGDGMMSDSASPSHTYRSPQIYTVRVNLIDTYGCQYDLEESLEVKKVVTLFMPSAFSPNNDGRNDVYFASSINLVSLQLKIFNRWGQVVYETDDISFRWDGRDLKGANVPEGVYVFHVKAVDVEGVKIEESRTITVIR